MDSHTQERTAPVKSAVAVTVSPTRVRPCSSKMLTTYLADIEQMLDEQSWDAAARESVDLPSIAVALSDPELRSSHDGIRKWLADWVRPLRTDGDSHELDYERVSKMLGERATGGDAEQRVPAKALRRLRLRRLARTPPARFASERPADREGNDIADMCKVVAEAIRRWYAHIGCSDPVVQANLGRLAVLR